MRTVMAVFSGQDCLILKEDHTWRANNLSKTINFTSTIQYICSSRSIANIKPRYLKESWTEDSLSLTQVDVDIIIKEANL